MINIPENMKFETPNVIGLEEVAARNEFEKTVSNVSKNIRRLPLEKAHIESLQWIGRLLKENSEDSYYNEIEFIKVRITELEFHSDLYRIATTLFRTIPYQCLIIFEYNYNRTEMIKYCASASHVSARDSDEHIIENVVLSQWIYPEDSKLEEKLNEALYSQTDAEDIYKKINEILQEFTRFDYITENEFFYVLMYLKTKSGDTFSEKTVQDIKADSFHCKSFEHGFSKYKINQKNTKVRYLSESVWRILKKHQEICSFLETEQINYIDGLVKRALDFCKKDLTEYVVTDGTPKISDDAFANFEKLKTLLIPDSVTEIGIRAFENCPELENISLSKSLTKIPKNAFYGCKSLKSIVIPEGVAEIETLAFAECTSLESVSLPKSLKKIGDEAFYNCINLENIEPPDNVENGSRVFAGCTKLKSKNYDTEILENKSFDNYMNGKNDDDAIDNSLFSNTQLLTVPEIQLSKCRECKKEKNYKESFTWAQMAAKQGNPEAFVELAWHYKKGKGIGRNYSKALKCLLKAYNKGNVHAKWDLKQDEKVFEKYLASDEFRQLDNSESMLKYLLDLESLNHNSQIQFYISKQYSEIGDFSKSFEWAKKSAEQNNINGIVKLGWHYITGNRCEKDLSKGKELCEQAARQGNAFAKYVLGDACLNGCGVEKNDEKAVELLKDSSGSSCPYAQLELGLMHFYGYAVEKNPNKTVEYFEKVEAEENNYVKALRMYEYALIGKFPSVNNSNWNKEKFGDCELLYVSLKFDKISAKFGPKYWDEDLYSHSYLLSIRKRLQ